MGTGTGTGIGGSGTDAGSSSGSSVAPDSGADNGSWGPVGCHLACACYQPPYSPAEITCSTACASAASVCDSDPSCWVCPYYTTASDCLASCASIAAMWSSENFVTYIADEIYGCAMQSSSCDAMTACSNAISSQQQQVCPDGG